MFLDKVECKYVLPYAKLCVAISVRVPFFLFFIEFKGFKRNRPNPITSIHIYTLRERLIFAKMAFPANNIIKFYFINIKDYTLNYRLVNKLYPHYFI